MCFNISFSRETWTITITITETIYCFIDMTSLTNSEAINISESQKSSIHKDESPKWKGAVPWGTVSDGSLRLTYSLPGSRRVHLPGLHNTSEIQKACLVEIRWFLNNKMKTVCSPRNYLAFLEDLPWIHRECQSRHLNCLGAMSLSVNSWVVTTWVLVVSICKIRQVRMSISKSVSLREGLKKHKSQLCKGSRKDFI